MNVIDELENIDWNFKRYRQTGIDNIHWYPANFIPQIPSILIANLSKPGSVVLDPFCGSGTTLVESARLGRVGIGIDINPLASLITKIKTTYIKPLKLEELLTRIEYLLENRLISEVLIPDFPNKNRWFHKDTLNELGNILLLISNENEKIIQNLLQVCFSAILKKCCTQRDHYTYVADNMFPKDDKELIYIDAKKEFLVQLKKTINSIINFYNDMEIQGIDPKKLLSQYKVKNEDSRSLKSIGDEEVDFIVTSPPYANVTDYTTGSRLSFYWLGIGDLQEYKKKEIGARWKRSRKRALHDYIDDIYKSFIQLKRVLKRGSYLCCVFGETSSIKKKTSLNLQLLTLLTNKLGFELMSESIQRNIYAKRIRAVRGVNKEHIYIFKKSAKKR